MPKRNLKKRKHPNPNSLGRKVKQFFRRNALTLIIAAIGVITSFAIYYLAYSEPDIRALRANQMFAYISEPLTKDGKCFFYVSVRQRFKNFSIKSGHIDTVNITNWSEDLIPEFKLIEVDKKQFQWGQEQDIQAIFTLTLDSASATRLVERNKPLEIETRFYDNTGKLLNNADDSEPIYFYADLSASGTKASALATKQRR